MIPEIKTLAPKTLAGKKMEMSFAENKTPELWKSFVPLKGTIAGALSNDLYSLQVYPPGFDIFNPDPFMMFEKWALVEVSDKASIPEQMLSVHLPGGLYAVFKYKGNPAEARKVFQYIFGLWLPQSGFLLDSRPHFEVLGAKYKNNDPESEEEIWIPVKRNI